MSLEILQNTQFAHSNIFIIVSKYDSGNMATVVQNSFILDLKTLNQRQKFFFVSGVFFLLLMYCNYYKVGCLLKKYPNIDLFILIPISICQ